MVGQMLKLAARVDREKLVDPDAGRDDHGQDDLEHEVFDRAHCLWWWQREVAGHLA